MLAPGRRLEAPGLGPGNPGPELAERGARKTGPEQGFPIHWTVWAALKRGKLSGTPPPENWRGNGVSKCAASP